MQHEKNETRGCGCGKNETRVCGCGKNETDGRPNGNNAAQRGERAVQGNRAYVAPLLSLVSLVTASMSMAACGGASAPKANTGAPAAAAQEQPASKFDVQAALAREAKSLQPVPVQGPGIVARVLASGKPTLKVEKGSYEVRIPIGSEAAIECTVFADPKEPGAMLSGIVQEIRGKFQVRDVALTGVDVVQETPLVRASLVYLAPAAKGALIGQVKLAFLAGIGDSAVCVHDELGYEKTFAEVTRSFFESRHDQAEPLATSRIDLYTAQLNGSPAGFTRTVVLIGQSGEHIVYEDELMVVVRSRGVFTTTDKTSVLSLDKQDRIVKGQYTMRDDGVPSMDVKIERAQIANTYRAAGTLRGKKVDAELKSQDKLGLPSELTIEKELADKLAKPGSFTINVTRYQPDEDPAALQVTKMTRSEGDPARTFRFAADGTGKTSFVGTADAEGRLTDGRMQADGVTLSFKRAFARGKP